MVALGLIPHPDGQSPGALPTVAKMQKATLAELRAFLGVLGLGKDGVKSILVARLVVEDRKRRAAEAARQKAATEAAAVLARSAQAEVDNGKARASGGGRYDKGRAAATLQAYGSAGGASAKVFNPYAAPFEPGSSWGAGQGGGSGSRDGGSAGVWNGSLGVAVGSPLLCLNYHCHKLAHVSELGEELDFVFWLFIVGITQHIEQLIYC